MSAVRWLAAGLALLDMWLVHQALATHGLADDVPWLYWLALPAPAYLMGWAFAGRLLGTLAIGSTTLVLSVPLWILTVVGLIWKFGIPGSSSGRPEDDIFNLMSLFALSWLVWPILLPSGVIVIGAVANAARLARRGFRSPPRQTGLFVGGLAFVLLFAVVTVFVVSHPPAQRVSLPLAYQTLDPNVVQLRDYLWANYDPELRLFREAPNVAANSFWIWSDAYLAAGEPPFDVPHLRKWTVLRTYTVDEEVFAFGSRVIDLGMGVKTEVEDPSVIFSDWREYGDRLLLAAINARYTKNTEREEELLAIAHRMWDGLGLRDKVYYVDGKYETYKTALYYYATGSEQALKVLASLQEKDSSSNRYGGMYTEYGGDGKPFERTDTNIETTAVTLLALNNAPR